MANNVLVQDHRTNQHQPNQQIDLLEPDSLFSRMRLLNKKFKNACNQVILLNNQIEYIQVRYDRAVKAKKRSYRYFERLRLATLEGIRNMIYEYACQRADELDEMQEQLVHEGIIDSDYDMEEVESNETVPLEAEAAAALEQNNNTDQPDREMSENSEAQ